MIRLIVLGLLYFTLSNCLQSQTVLPKTKFKEVKVLTNIKQIRMEPTIVVPSDLGEIKKQDQKQLIVYSLPIEKINLTSSFGYRIHPILKKVRFHNGIDINANYEPIKAILHGIVTDSGYKKGLGYFLEIAHGNYKVIYGHLSRIISAKNQMVIPGDIVAISGNSGISTGPHLHLSVSKNNLPINPLHFLFNVSNIETKESLISFLTK